MTTETKGSMIARGVQEIELNRFDVESKKVISDKFLLVSNVDAQAIFEDLSGKHLERDVELSELVMILATKIIPEINKAAFYALTRAAHPELTIKDAGQYTIDQAAKMQFLLCLNMADVTQQELDDVLGVIQEEEKNLLEQGRQSIQAVMESQSSQKNSSKAQTEKSSGK